MQLSEIKVDPALVEHGGWVSDIPGMEDLELQVRPTNNPQYRRLYSKLVRALPKAKRIGGRPDDDEEDRITSVCLQQTALLGWRNLKDGDTDIPFSAELAEKLMLQPEYREFRDAVRYASLIVGDNATADQEDAAKN